MDDHDEHMDEDARGAKNPHVVRGKKTTPVTLSTLLWADRSIEETVDYEMIPTWGDDEEDSDTKGAKLFNVSKKTEQF